MIKITNYLLILYYRVSVISYETDLFNQMTRSEESMRYSHVPEQTTRRMEYVVLEHNFEQLQPHEAVT